MYLATSICHLDLSSIDLSSIYHLPVICLSLYLSVIYHLLIYYILIYYLSSIIFPFIVTTTTMTSTPCVGPHECRAPYVEYLVRLHVTSVKQAQLWLLSISTEAAGQGDTQTVEFRNVSICIFKTQTFRDFNFREVCGRQQYIIILTSLNPGPSRYSFFLFVNLCQFDKLVYSIIIFTSFIINEIENTSDIHWWLVVLLW